jgi:hypothetical protein
VTPRPIVVCEASPRAPTVTVRARKVGAVVVREVTVDTVPIALSLLALLALQGAPRGA